MKTFRKKKLLTSVLIIAAAISLFASRVILRTFLPQATQAEIPASTLSMGLERKTEIFNTAVEEKKWSTRIEEVGALTAYKEFKETYAGTDFSSQHLVAHVFGKVLYEKKGISGVVVCDSTFAFGCYHSFFAAALSSEGPSIIFSLDEACVKKFGPLGTGCTHGIGHGILEYLGPKRLEQALALCGKTTQKNPLFGCTSGVFMEHNTPIIIDAAGAETRVRLMPVNGDPYAPCPTLIDKRFRRSCYFEIGNWWRQNSFGFEKMGALCANLRDLEEQEICFESVGGVAAIASAYDADQAAISCKEMPSKNAETLCRAGAAWTLYADPIHRSSARDVCHGLAAEDNARCLQKANIMCNGIEDAAEKKDCFRDNPL